MTICSGLGEGLISTTKTHFETCSAEEVSLRALGMVNAAMAHSHGRRANGQAANVVLSTGAIAEFSSLIDKLEGNSYERAQQWPDLPTHLVKSWKYVICKLDLSDSCMAHSGHSNAKSNETLFGERCVEHAITAKLLSETHCAPEDATKSHIFSKHHRIVILGERYSVREVNARDEKMLVLHTITRL